MKRGAEGLWVPGDDEHSGVIAAHARRYDEFMHAIPISRLETAVDGGAHVGYWTVRMARDFRRVYAFEPRPENFECLARNTLTKGEVIVLPWALGSHSGWCIPMHNPGSRPDNSGAWHVRQADAGEEMFPLDETDIAGRLDLLKLDIEGMEALALAGAAELIRRDWPAVIIEENEAPWVHFGLPNGAARELLEGVGYCEVAAAGRDHLFLHVRAGEGDA